MTSGNGHANGMSNKRTKLIPPDGGWGWMVVLGTASTNIFNQSMLSLFSLLYGDLIEKMGYDTQGAALVLSTMLFVTNFGGPMSGSFLKLTSPRVVAITGAALCTSGILLSGFSQALWHLVGTYGILLGAGLGLIQSSTFVSINAYFKSNRGRAVGVAMAGTGLGQMLMPFVVRYLLNMYTFRGCCLILSALSLHGIAGCLLLQPVEWHMKCVEDDSDEKKHLLAPKTPAETTTMEPNGKNIKVIQAEDRRATEPSLFGSRDSSEKKSRSSSYKDLNFANISSTAESLPMMNKDYENEEVQTKTTVETAAPAKTGTFQKLIELFDVRLLADARFLIIIIGTALAVTSIQNFSLIFPLFLKHSANLDMMRVATCMSAVAGADIIGRLTLPALADRYKVKARVSLVLTSIWIIIMRQILAYQSEMAALIATAAFYGFGRSMLIVARNIAISEYCKPEQVPSAVGWGMMAMGIMVPPLGLFLGWIRDYTGSYVVCITAQNLLLGFLLVTWIPDLLYMRCKEKRKAGSGDV